MMAEASTGSRPSSPSSARSGFSLAELVITLVLMSLIMALLLPLLVSARSMVGTDQVRTELGQNLRAAMDLMGADIRIAGERFPEGSVLQLSPIEIVAGGTDPDEVLLRRNLWGGTLPVCEAVLTGVQQTIRVVRNAAWLSSSPGDEHPECGQPTDTNGWPQNLGEVDALADSIGAGGVLHGFLIDPATGNSEFIQFTVPADADATGMIERTTASALTHSYTLENRPLIYILSERRYRVLDETLELVVNGDGGAPFRAAAHVVGLVARYVLPDGTVVDAIPSGMTWRDITSLEITLTVSMTQGPETAERTVTARFFPRNILSR